MSIRRPIAMNYIECVENIMREIGYLGKDELIEPSNLIYNSLIIDLSVSQREQLYSFF